MPKTVKGQSYVKDWINAHVAYAGDDCLIWPFSKNWNGYGHVGAGGGKIVYAHRMMCSLAHGEPPHRSTKPLILAIMGTEDALIRDISLGKPTAKTCSTDARPEQ